MPTRPNSKVNLEDYLNLMQTEYERSWVGTMTQTYTPFPPRTD
jgi:hypothetical protein